MASFALYFSFTELLDMPLKSITSAWESGELFSCNYTRTEVVFFLTSFTSWRDSEAFVMMCVACRYKISSRLYLQIHR